MISDYQILGLDETLDAALIKKAYRKRVKQLHPDTADSSVTPEQKARNSFLMVEVCKAYRRLVSSAQGNAAPRVDPAPGGTSENIIGAGRNSASKIPAGRAAAPSAPVRHADPAYAYYKKGITLFYQIHPSAWTKSEDRKKALSVAALFPKAYYYLSVVADEYPESAWAHDAVEKMGLIEERMKLYRSIVDSFKDKEEKDA